MKYGQMQAVSMEVASILDEHRATHNDVARIIEETQKCMVAKQKVMLRSSRAGLGAIWIPDADYYNW